VKVTYVKWLQSGPQPGGRAFGAFALRNFQNIALQF